MEYVQGALTQRHVNQIMHRLLALLVSQDTGRTRAQSNPGPRVEPSRRRTQRAQTLPHNFSSGFVDSSPCGSSILQTFVQQMQEHWMNEECQALTQCEYAFVDGLDGFRDERFRSTPGRVVPALTLAQLTELETCITLLQKLTMTRSVAELLLEQFPVVLTLLIQMDLWLQCPTSALPLTMATIVARVFKALGISSVYRRNAFLEIFCLNLLSGYRECTLRRRCPLLCIYGRLFRTLLHLETRHVFIELFFRSGDHLLGPLWQSVLTLVDFDLAADVFGNLQQLVLVNPHLTLRYFGHSFERWILDMHLVITKSNYYFKRLSIELLAKVLLEPMYFSWMVTYVKKESNLKWVMMECRSLSRKIREAAFELLKLFVANPYKTSGVCRIIRKNRRKLGCFIEVMAREDERECLLFQLQVVQAPAVETQAGFSAIVLTK